MPMLDRQALRAKPGNKGRYTVFGLRVRPGQASRSAACEVLLQVNHRQASRFPWEWGRGGHAPKEGQAPI